MKIIRRHRLHRLSATTIQCSIRCMFARVRTNAIRDKNAHLRHNAMVIQCSFRQHLARRRRALFAKLAIVRAIMAGWEEDKERQREAHRVDGAANTIARYWRGSKIRENLKKIIFWNRYDKAIVLQKYTRGYFGRKVANELLRIKRKKEKRVFDAAQLMQKYIRGINARKVYAGLVHAKKLERAKKRALKKKYLENAAMNNVKGGIIGALRKMIPFRYVLGEIYYSA